MKIQTTTTATVTPGAITSATILPSPAVISSVSVTKDSQIREKTSPGQTFTSAESILRPGGEEEEEEEGEEEQGESFFTGKSGKNHRTIDNGEGGEQEEEEEEEPEDLDDELDLEESEDEMHVDHSRQSIKGQSCDDQDHLTLVKEPRGEEAKTLETSGELLRECD